MRSSSSPLSVYSNQSVTPKKLTLDERAEALAQEWKPLFIPGQVMELRALEVRQGNRKPYTQAGYFDMEP
jgi:hypothetical protein